MKMIQLKCHMKLARTKTSAYLNKNGTSNFPKLFLFFFFFFWWCRRKWTLKCYLQKCAILMKKHLQRTCQSESMPCSKSRPHFDKNTLLSAKKERWNINCLKPGEKEKKKKKAWHQKTAIYCDSPTPCSGFNSNLFQ